MEKIDMALINVAGTPVVVNPGCSVFMEGLDNMKAFMGVNNGIASQLKDNFDANAVQGAANQMAVLFVRQNKRGDIFLRIQPNRMRKMIPEFKENSSEDLYMIAGIIIGMVFNPILKSGLNVKFSRLG